ncbi:MAG: CDGSH iron-sulfur domain-containing protein [Acidobacteriota bacterium]
MACEITIRPNGPILIQGDFVLKDGEGRAYDLGGRTNIALCRCGLSKDKPFCDGSHRDGFSSVVEARELPRK